MMTKTTSLDSFGAGGNASATEVKLTPEFAVSDPPK